GHGERLVVDGAVANHGVTSVNVNGRGSLTWPSALRTATGTVAGASQTGMSTPVVTSVGDTTVVGSSYPFHTITASGANPVRWTCTADDACPSTAVFAPERV